MYPFNGIKKGPDQLTSVVVRIHLTGYGESLAWRASEQHINRILISVQLSDISSNVTLYHDIGIVWTIESPCFSCVVVNLIGENRMKTGSVEADVQAARPRKQRNRLELLHHHTSLPIEEDTIFPALPFGTSYPRGTRRVSESMCPTQTEDTPFTTSFAVNACVP